MDPFRLFGGWRAWEREADGGGPSAVTVRGSDSVKLAGRAVIRLSDPLLKAARTCEVRLTVPGPSCPSDSKRGDGYLPRATLGCGCQRYAMSANRRWHREIRAGVV